KNAARVGDPVACPPDAIFSSVAVISAGRADVLINGNPAARIWDQTSHAGVIRQGAPRVYIGGSGADGDTLALAILRLKASAFGQTAEGKRVLARLEEMQAAGKLDFGPLNGQQGRYVYEGEGKGTLRIHGDYRDDVEGTARLLAHEGTHALDDHNHLFDKE